MITISKLFELRDSVDQPWDNNGRIITVNENNVYKMQGQLYWDRLMARSMRTPDHGGPGYWPGRKSLVKNVSCVFALGFAFSGTKPYKNTQNVRKTLPHVGRRRGL